MDNAPPPSLGDSAALRVSTQIMVLSVIVLFVVITVILLLNIYAKWHLSSSEDPAVVTWRRQMIAALRTNGTGGQTSAAANRRGLDRQTLESLPVMIYNPKDFKDGLECSVCLSEVEEGEKARLLPKCNHGFHVDCIDMWFKSHTTCPLCRNPVTCGGDGANAVIIDIREDSNSSSSDDEDDDSIFHSTRGPPVESSVFPTNELVWGNQSQVSSHEFSSSSEGQEQKQGETAASTSSEPSSKSDLRINGGKHKGSLVIDIPKRPLNSENYSSVSPSPMSTNRQEDMKSPTTPMMTGLNSLKRLLSRGKRIIATPGSSSEHTATGVHQVEQV